MASYEVICHLDTRAEQKSVAGIDPQLATNHSRRKLIQ